MLLGNVGAVNKGLISLLAGRGVQAVLTIALLKVLTARLNESEVAHYYYIASFFTWFSLLIINPVTQWSNRHISVWTLKYDWHSIIGYFVAFHFAVAVIAAGVAIIVEKAFPGSGLDPALFAVCAAVGILSITLQQGLSGFQNLVGSKKSYGIQVASAQILIFLPTTVVFSMREVSATIWIGLLALGNLMAVALFSFTLRNSFKRSEGKRARIRDLISKRDIVSFCLPVLGVTVSVWMQTQGYRFFYAKTGDLTTLAHLAVGLALATNITGTFEAIFYQYFLPEYYGTLATNAESADQIWSDMFKSAIILFAIVCAGLCAFAPVVILLLTQKSYLASIAFLRWAALVEFLRILANVIYIRFVGQKRIVKTIPIYFLSSLINLLFFVSSLYSESHKASLIIAGLLLGACSNFLGLTSVNANSGMWKLPYKKFVIAVLASAPLFLGLLLGPSSSWLSISLGLAMAAVYSGGVILCLNPRKKSEVTN